LPVPDTTGVWLLSPGKVIDAFIHAHELPSAAWGVNRVVNLPGITVTVRQMLDALANVAGAATAARVTYQPDERIQRIVKTWPAGFRTDRALKLGFKADANFEDVIREYIRDQGLRI
jgi:nucleoside-diphosphate-sugar epimerase